MSKFALFFITFVRYNDDHIGLLLCSAYIPFSLEFSSIGDIPNVTVHVERIAILRPIKTRLGVLFSRLDRFLLVGHSLCLALR